MFEGYLYQRWDALKQMLGALPDSDDAIALMRLVVQAQNSKEQQAVVEAYKQLNEADRSTLALEMGLTGISGQEYSTTRAENRGLGPAFLIYYSPAFLRTVAKNHPRASLEILAAIYRGARSIWPFGGGASSANTAGGGGGGSPNGGSPSDGKVGGGGDLGKDLMKLVGVGSSRSSMATVVTEGTVTVRIDQLKDMDVEKLLQAHSEGDKWYLSRRNALEAIVVRHNQLEAAPPDLDRNKTKVRELEVVSGTSLKDMEPLSKMEA